MKKPLAERAWRLIQKYWLGHLTCNSGAAIDRTKQREQLVLDQSGHTPPALARYVIPVLGSFSVQLLFNYLMGKNATSSLFTALRSISGLKETIGFGWVSIPERTVTVDHQGSRQRTIVKMHMISDRHEISRLSIS
eukprot:TRINITY_DN7097_c0_g2_i2.p1 TRINITY_DN7097_c0_g2~~TRINITY_DN7097_c0_g2_i2.p1  ORF type:complete len:136 (-),score=20.17 TRINITY_DN7097_c0_g2_i2:1764-2171(-)